MSWLAPGQANTCINPVLSIATFGIDGIMVDAFSVQFQIWDLGDEAASAEPLLIFPDPDDELERADVDVDVPCPTGDRLRQGHYIPRWTADADAALGRYEIRWWVVLEEDGEELTYRQVFELAAQSSGIYNYSYVSTTSTRAEGIGNNISDARLQRALVMATREIEHLTQRFFIPRYMDLLVDGSGNGIIKLQQPIIAITSVGTLTPEQEDPEVITDASSYRVYNRHLQGVFDPDDRKYPRIQTAGSAFDWGFPFIGGMTPTSILNPGLVRWPRGRQNLKVSGIFGYTEPDGSPMGGTPEEIKWATRRIAMRHLPEQANRSAIASHERDRLVTSESAAGQSMSFGTNIQQSVLTGYDPLLDRVLARYMRPPASRVA